MSRRGRPAGFSILGPSGEGSVETSVAEYAGISLQSQAAVPVICKGRTIQMGFRADIVVANAIILEIKTVSALVRLMKRKLSPGFA
jgi:hypothetical protein